MPKVNTNVAAQWHDLVTDVRTSAQGGLHDLGQYREEDGKGYRYVQMDAGATAAVVGNLAYHTATNYTVTATVANTASGDEAGVFVAVIATSGFGWIQTHGNVTINTSGVDDIVKGDGLIGAASAAGTCRRCPLPGGNAASDIQTSSLLAAQKFGKALADDNDGANTVAAFVMFD